MNPVALFAVVLYILFLLFYAVWGLFLLYHLLRFAPRREAALVGSAIFLSVTVVLLLISVAYFTRVDWSASLVFPSAAF